MANASSKRIAQANETALKNLQLGLLVVNLLAPTLRFLLSLLTSRRAFPRTLPFICQVLSLGASVVTWRWFLSIGSPKRDGTGQVRVGEDLGGKGVIELGWDLIYMTWICTVGSALFGDWIWWSLLLIPGFGAYKLFSTVQPLLAMFLPSIFGPRGGQAAAPIGGAAAAEGAEGVPAESRRQAKLRARMEKGDKRIQQVQKR